MSGARLGSIAPFFIVADLERAVAFYVDRLGFALQMQVPEDDPFFAIVGRDDVRILLKQIGEGVPPLPNRARHQWARWDAFIHVADPELYAEECRVRGLEVPAVAVDPDDGLFGFEVTDADGYVIYFGRPVDL